MAARRATPVHTSPPQWLAGTASSVLGCARFTSSNRQKRDHHKSPVGGLNPLEPPVYFIDSLPSMRAETRPSHFFTHSSWTAQRRFLASWPFLLGGL